MLYQIIWFTLAFWLSIISFILEWKAYCRSNNGFKNNFIFIGYIL